MTKAPSSLQDLRRSLYVKAKMEPTLSGVNYFFWSTTIISPDQRQLLLTSSAGAKRRRGRGAKPARVWGFFLFFF